jgi:uncharacterized protein
LRVIRCLGQQRFRIESTDKLKHGLWMANVSHVQQDQALSIPPELLPCRSLLENALARLPAAARADLLPSEPSPAQLADCGWVANRWCQLLPLPTELKQRLLELDSPLIRLELISDLLDKLGLRSVGS